MVVRSKAPLRIGLAGGGTDVSPYSDNFGGYILNATIDMFAYCTIEESKENKVLFKALDKGVIEEYSDINDMKLDSELKLHIGVYKRIVKDYNNGQALYIKVSTSCDAPPGSGLGSSSTMVVCMVKAYVELLNLPLGDYDIAYLAYTIERNDLGLTGGKQDQYAATFGGFNFMEFYKDKVIVNPLRIKSWIKEELESSLILFYTGISRESANIIEEQKKNIVKKNQKSIEAMHKLKKDSVLMKEFLLKGEIKSFASVLGESWIAKKQMAKSISNDYIDKVYEDMREYGVIGGKISGAGGGGFMLLICDPVEKVKLCKKLALYDGKVIGAHFHSEGVVSWCIQN